ncbi:MAG: hypothetical protein M1431_06135 [Candidatus Thermoplasmatota archaeon]|nr:hypothetical protein [Candidatus Thermoplasmatota archaeon]
MMKPVESDYPSDFHRNRKKLGVSIAIVIIIVVSVFIVAGYNERGTVNVLYIKATIDENGAMVSRTYQENFHTLSSGGQTTFSLPIYNSGSSPVTLSSVSVYTIGFDILHTNLPLNVKANSNAILVLTLSLPYKTYTGGLEIGIS